MRETRIALRLIPKWIIGAVATLFNFKLITVLRVDVITWRFM